MRKNYGKFVEIAEKLRKLWKIAEIAGKLRISISHRCAMRNFFAEHNMQNAKMDLNPGFQEIIICGVHIKLWMKAILGSSFSNIFGPFLPLKEEHYRSPSAAGQVINRRGGERLMLSQIIKQEKNHLASFL
eukprot:EG_transcript_31278